MSTGTSIQEIRAELETGIGLYKCQKCGCMTSGLENLSSALVAAGMDEAKTLAQDIETWRARMLPVQYSCLGCAYCYPAVAQNAFSTAFPDQSLAPALACEFRVGAEWPVVIGEYRVLDAAGPVAISTLASTRLVDELAENRPKRVGIVGKTETENIGIDKIVKNVISNPAIQYLIVAGIESAGHRSGQALLALAEHGIDDKGRIIGAQGKRPILRNVTTDEVHKFRQQVQIIDLIGCEDTTAILARIEELSIQEPEPCG